MEKERIFRAGERVKVDGEIGTILYFTPGHWTTHAVVLFPEGDERAILIEELESGHSRLKPVTVKTAGSFLDEALNSGDGSYKP